MAWMKIDLELPDKPEVHAIAGMLNLDPNAVVGMLIRVWQWFDKHTVDGNAYGVTYSLPDRISGVSGFGEAMAFVGWLEQQDKTLVMPKFDSHTSESAKARALASKRVSAHRVKSNANVNANSNGDSVTNALPREEKEKDIKHIGDKPPFSFKTELLNLGLDAGLVDDWMKVRKTKKASNTKTAFTLFINEVAKAGWTVADAVTHCTQKDWKGFDSEWVKDIKPAISAPVVPFDREAYEAKRKAEADAAKARMRQEQAEWEAQA